MREWKKYRHRNSVGADCQLVTAVNAYHYLTGKRITDRRYERLADLCHCRNGSAIGIEKVWRDLGIREKDRLMWLPLSSTKDKRGICHLRRSWARLLPMEISVWHKFFGFHSILAVEYEPRTVAFRVTNFKHVVSTGGWIFYEDLKPHVRENPDRKEPRWRYRVFMRE